MTTKSLIKPITAPALKPIVAPVKIQPSAKTEAVPKPTPVDTVPCTVAVHLNIVSEPTRDGLGAAWPMDTRESSGTRAIGVSLYREILLVSRALSKGDQLTLRFLASLLLCEFLIASRVSHLREIQDILEGLEKKLGGPFDFRSNFSHLSTILARNEMTAKIDSVFSGKPFVWFTLECDLCPVSTLFQWNGAIRKPDRTKKATAEGGLK
jgi:hypothetical protein